MSVPMRVLLLALALAWAGAPPAAAQDGEQPVLLEVGGLAGARLRGKARRFLEVHTVLENRGASDVRGVLRVYRARGPASRTPAQDLFYERRVALPAGARRAEPILYYCQEDEPRRALCVAFQPDEGPTVTVQPDLDFEPDRLAVLVLTSRDPEPAARLVRAALVPGPRRAWRADPLVAQLPALPRHLAGYESVDAVVLTDLDPDALAPDQVAALLGWVAAGGDLIVADTPRSELPGPVRAALPVTRAAGTRAEELPLVELRALGLGLGWPGEERVLVQRTTPAAGAEVLAGAGEVPLVVRGRHGAGQVTYLAFPLDAAPLAGWRALPAFAGGLLRLPREELHPPSVALEAPPLEEVLLNLSESITRLQPPSGLLVAPLLLGYVLLVGPGTYLLLAPRRRLGLAIPAGAACALAFSTLFFGIGRVYKGDEDLAARAALIELPVAPGGARVETMTGHFSTRQGQVGGVAPAGAAVGVLAEVLTSREGVVHQDEAAVRLERLTCATWALRRYRTLAGADLGHVEADLALDGPRVVGELRNRTTLRLETPLLLTEAGCIDLGAALEPGQAIELGAAPSGWDREQLDLSRLGLPGALVRRDAANGFPALYTGSVGVAVGDPFSGSATDRVLAALRWRLARVSAGPGAARALLVARAAHDPGGVAIDGVGPPASARALALVELTLPQRRPGFGVGLEPRVLASGPNASNSWVPVAGGTGSPALLDAKFAPEAWVDLAVTVPGAGAAAVERLSVRWRCVPDLVQVPATLRAFHFGARQWVDLVDLREGERDPETGMRRMTLQRPRRQQGASRADLAPDDLIDPSSGALLLRLRTELAELRLARLVVDAQVR